MSPKPTILATTILAFLVPVGVVLVQRGEQVQALLRVEPGRGHVLYFSSPG